MVKKILKLFNAEFGGLHKAALVLAVSSVVSAFFGLFRDRLLANIFGTGPELDIYYAAFKIPDIIYVISLSVVSVNTLIPFLFEKISISKEEARSFLDNIFNFFAVLMLFLVIIAFFLMPYFSAITVPGFSDEGKSQLVAVSRILLLSPFLLGLSNLISSVIQSYNKFFVYALSPIFYNLGIVIGILFLYPLMGVNGVAAGVIIGAFMHFSIQLPSILRLGFFPRVNLNFNFREIWKVAVLSFPRTLGLGLSQITLIFITAAASIVGSGSIAIFNLSFNLQSVPLAVIGMSYSVAAFPTMARLFVNNQKKEFTEHALSAVRQIIFWSVPASALIIVLRAQIVRVIFGSGNFDWRDTRLTAAALSIFALSITAQSLSVLFIRSFYASGKTWKPIVVNIISAVTIISLAPLFIKLFGSYESAMSFFSAIFRVKGIEGTIMLALPLAFSTGMVINAVVLFIIFEKDFGGIWDSIKKIFSEVLAASLLMSFVAYFMLSILDNFLDINTFAGIFAQGAIASFMAFLVWFIVLRLTGNRELEEIISTFRNKFWRTPVIAPEPEAIDRQ